MGAIAAVVLVMIVNEANDPPMKILVPPPGDVGPYVPITSVVEVVVTQPTDPTTATTKVPSPQQPGQHQTSTTRQPATGQIARTTAARTPATKTTGLEPPAPPDDGPVPVIVCPNVAAALPAVPAGAQTEVTRELRNLETWLAEANRRLVASVGISDPGFVHNAILGPLISQRIASLDRIAIAIGRFGPRPAGLERLAPCSVR
ncbi:hypothetical protein DMH04_53310 [Kibdelosporangium aridum]|uniref:Uncharacterized protein n=1 Tax=Kibdelosporangium aridum TaxID=2030 RepID=A0A428Y356_KIBAR|nr:hypothetical protein DMH04_53310 [Kibdelosporangium aridum]